MKKTLILALSLFVGITASAQDAAVASQTDDHYFDVTKNLEIFNTIYKNLDMLYVDSLNADQTVGYGINAMLRSLDPYTEYYPENKSGDVKMMLMGKYAGIGSLIRYNYKARTGVHRRALRE